MSTSTATLPDPAAVADPITLDTVWVVVEHRHSFDIDEQPISRTTLHAAAGFFADESAARAAVESLNSHLYDDHDRFLAQQFRNHSAAVKAYERAMLERKVILDAGLAPSSPEPVRPPETAPEVSFAEFLAHLHATTPYRKYEAVALSPGNQKANHGSAVIGDGGGDF